MLNALDDYSHKMIEQLVSVSIGARQAARFLSQLIEQRGKLQRQVQERIPETALTLFQCKGSSLLCAVNVDDCESRLSRKQRAL